MTATELLSSLQAKGIELHADGERLLFRPVDGLTSDEVDALRRHKREIMSLLRPGTNLCDIPFENGGYGGLPKAQIEAALVVQDSLGILDPVRRKYNVLAWVRGYLQYQSENDGPLYESLLAEMMRLGEILDA
jgi:hypothetical protein